MKIFISHKNEDATAALNIQQTLRSAGVDTYLDVLDDITSENGEHLTKHIRWKLRECSDVIVVLSNKTKFSWWVPFEIGLATENDMPIANYLVNYEPLPEYLEYWPRLKSQQDVRKYVETRNEVANQILLEKRLYHEAFNQRTDSKASEVERFYTQLKKKL
jgi:conserved hypothetical protein